MSIDFKEAFGFIFKTDYPDLFNFEDIAFLALYAFTPPQ